MPDIRVARLVEVNKPLVTGTVEKLIPGPKDVLVKVEACCLVPNSYNIVTGRAGMPLPELPCVFGLDVAGEIEAVGKHVLGLRPGDRVYVDPLLTCGTCHQCRSGPKDLCINSCLRAYFAVHPGGSETLKHYPIGGLSEYVLSPDANIAVLPPNFDIDLASRLGYIGTSFAGLKKAQTGSGKSLLINGVTGTLGYAAVAIALGLGCTKILGIGRNKKRLAEVQEMSGKLTSRIVVRSTEDEGDICAWIKQETGGLGPDAMFDCLGVGGDATLTSKYIDTIKAGGRAVLAAGGAGGKIEREYSRAMDHDVAILGSIWFNSAEIDELITLVSAGVIDFSFTKHKYFSLDEVNDAFKYVGNRPGGAINVVVQPQSSSAGRGALDRLSTSL
ncbi:MAG: hypothetical protein Q9176_000959 [Flavoplaca citrina]